MEGRGLMKGGVLLLALSLLRLGADHWRHRDASLEDAGSDLQWLLDESRQARDDQVRRTRPLVPGETLDPNRSPEEDLDRLPGVGPSLAGAVVAEREQSGGFQRPEDLLRVRGIGPATLERIRPFLDFSEGIPVELRMVRTEEAWPGEAGASSAGPAGVLPVVGAGPDRGVGGGDAARAPGSRSTRMDLNRASSEELQALPGIGPALAERILESRAREGYFRSLEDLLRVRGIGPATLARIRDLVFAGTG
jgi:competence protein ComEA